MIRKVWTAIFQMRYFKNSTDVTKIEKLFLNEQIKSLTDKFNLFPPHVIYGQPF